VNARITFRLLGFELGTVTLKLDLDGGPPGYPPPGAVHVRPPAPGSKLVKGISKLWLKGMTA